MTKVTFYQDSDGAYMGFTCEEHAGYADEGEDIVCAAISALVFNTVNSIEAFTEDVFTLDTDASSAFLSFRLENTPSEQCTLLIKSLLLGLQSMEDGQYSDFIDIIFEEV
ncbi:MAG: ribosomal-processing cysteine protease Prp [Lachnospiraceae bacterium]|nr:ribosomal-processing cysteine protease Prp [Lachnospiraceae bacterium]